jgi:hypothetical protein
MRAVFHALLVVETRNEKRLLDTVDTVASLASICIPWTTLEQDKSDSWKQNEWKVLRIRNRSISILISYTIFPALGASRGTVSYKHK